MVAGAQRRHCPIDRPLARRLVPTRAAHRVAIGMSSRRPLPLAADGPPPVIYHAAVPRRRTCSTGVALLAALAACSRTGEPGRQAPPPRVVALVPVATIELPRTLDVTGVLAAQEELVLGFQVAGRLRALNVDVGDTVQARQLLAALDDADFTLARDRAQAALMAARERLGLAADGEQSAVDVETTAPVREALAVQEQSKLQRDRTKQMVQENLRAQAELEAAEAACEVAASRVQGARDEVRTWIAEHLQRTVELQQSLKNLQDSQLLAPWAGRVAERRAVAGQFVQVGSPVLTLLRIDPLRLRLLVPERLAGEAREGQDVRFTVDGGDGRERQGVLRRLAPGIDRGNRTLLVEAEVRNQDGALRAGGFCRAHIVVREREPVLAVPKPALVSFAGVDRVFAVEQGKAKERLVVPGRSVGEQIEIVRGLAAGDRVVAAAQGLVAGAPVTVQD